MIYNSLINSFEEYLNTHNNPELSENSKALSGDLLLAISRAFTDCAYSTKNFDTLESIQLDDEFFDVYMVEQHMDVIHADTGVLVLQLLYLGECYSIEHYDVDIADEFYPAEGYTGMSYQFNDYKNFNACKLEVLEHELKMLRNKMNQM